MVKLTLLLALAVFMASCEAGDTGDREALAKLDDAMMERIEVLLDEWAGCESQGLYQEAQRAERKIRKLADTHFAVLRAGLLSTSARKRAVSAAAIGFSLDTGIVRFLVDLLQDKNPIVRANALLGLSRVGYKRLPVEPVAIMLKDEDEHVRRTAVMCLESIAGAMNEKAIAKELVEAMIDVDSGVRMNAARALGKIGNMEGLEVLVTRGLKDEDPRVRYNSAIALARLKSYDAAEGLIEAGLRESNEAVKREIGGALTATTGEKYDTRFDEWSAWWKSREAGGSGK